MFLFNEDGAVMELAINPHRQGHILQAADCLGNGMADAKAGLYRDMALRQRARPYI